jgi:hypothetical protein
MTMILHSKVNDGGSYRQDSRIYMGMWLRSYLEVQDE